MSIKKKKNIEQEKVEEKKETIVLVDALKERTLTLEDFLETNKETNGKHNTLSFGFKVYWIQIEQKSGLERMSYKEWNEQFIKFKNRKIN